MRKAIVLIELIFAIVVIAFTLTAVPNLLSMSNKSAKSAITQEAASNGASNIAMIMSAYWDEASTDNHYSNYILGTTAGSGSLNQQFQPPLIPGMPSLPTHRRPGSNLSTSRIFAPNDLNATPYASFGLDANDGNSTKDDVDDYNGVSYTLISRQATNASTGDYKDKNVTLTTDVSYMDDNATYSNSNIIDFIPFQKVNNPTNIKMITTTITSPNDPNKRIVLKAFSCNIGGVKYKERIFP